MKDFLIKSKRFIHMGKRNYAKKKKTKKSISQKLRLLLSLVVSFEIKIGKKKRHFCLSEMSNDIN